MTVRLASCLALFSLLLASPSAKAQSIMVWGDDTHGQVSDKPTGATFTKLSTRRLFLLALGQDGSLTAWGEDHDGQVSGAPAGTGFIDISAGGFHGLALRTDGSIAAWGLDNTGQVSGAPLGTGFVGIQAGDSFSLALRADGSIAAWGSVLGIPIAAPAGPGFSDLACGGKRAFALRPDGSIEAFSSPGIAGGSTAPLSGAGFTQINAYSTLGIALHSSGSVQTWGSSFAASTGGDFVQVANSKAHYAALRADGGIEAWGQDNSGQVSSVLQAPAFQAVVCGSGFTAALYTIDCNGNGIADNADIASGFSMDCNGNGFPDECDITFGESTDFDGNLAPDDCVTPALDVDVTELSVVEGGVQTFSLSAPVAGQAYLLLGSSSGTSPGLQAGAFSLPLNVDSYFLHTLTAPSHPPLQNSFGVLLPGSGGGAATASFTLPAAVDAALVGLTLHHAYVSMDPWTAGVTFISNPVPLTLLP